MSLKELFRFPASRLSRRIAFWVFISVIVIETLIFIPSYKNREKELLSQLKEISAARVALIMKIAKPDAIVMHPGPMNRGVEIDSSVADGHQSVILPQVTFGIAVRMAVMSILAGQS